MSQKYETLKSRKKVAVSDLLRVVLFAAIALYAIIKLTHMGF
jgi:hypothetical protein